MAKLKENYYETWLQAAKAAKKLGITTAQEYIDKHTEDSKLVLSPPIYYKDFPGWATFLGKK